MTRDEVLVKLRELKPRFQEMKIKRMALFGSYARDEAGPESDVDIVIEQSVPIGFSDLIEIQETVSNAVQRPVDVTTFRAAFQRKHISHILQDIVDV